jgi:hypothetical protein
LELITAFAAITVECGEEETNMAFDKEQSSSLPG